MAKARFDYTTVGHVTIDVLADGSRRAGGSAFYSALQAARLGLRTLVITRGRTPEIEELLAPYRGELALAIAAAPQTTTLQTTGAGATRRQRLLAWAGPIEEHVAVDTAILHIAPVARETPARWSGRADFVGVTPQGLVRAWTGGEGDIREVPLAAALLPERCDAIVFSESERAACTPLIGKQGRSRVIGESAGGRTNARSPANGRALVAITAGASPTALHLPSGAIAHVPVPAIENFVDDLGAGDVFAAAFFVALHEGRAPSSAAAFASAAAGVRISASGANAIGDRSKIETRLRAAA